MDISLAGRSHFLSQMEAINKVSTLPSKYKNCADVFLFWYINKSFSALLQSFCFKVWFFEVKDVWNQESDNDKW